MFGISLWWIAGGVALLALVGIGLYYWLRKPDAYVYVPKGTAFAAWQYKQLPMHECAFCGRKVSMERHHCVPQSVDSTRVNDPTNLVVLCGGGKSGCHFIIGHKRNYKKFNPYVAEICEKYGGPPLDSHEWHEKLERERQQAKLEQEKQQEKANENREN